MIRIQVQILSWQGKGKVNDTKMEKVFFPTIDMMCLCSSTVESPELERRSGVKTIVRVIERRNSFKTLKELEKPFEL